nr:MAG TPA: hypothetical protein [Caudoviricetes sp.]DAL04600.1 MAG TPA: hypothetical protein [Caudoviricetes sp.]
MTTMWGVSSILCRIIRVVIALINTDNHKYYDRADVKIMEMIRIVLTIQFCCILKQVLIVKFS